MSPVPRSRSGRLLAVGGWALAEALVWPIMPDALLAPLAASNPTEWWQLVLATSAGSTLGGLLLYSAGRRLSVERLRARQPLLRPAMITTARRWLEREGPAGLRHHPLSGIPLRLFALEAAAIGIPLAPFLAWAAAVRGLRFGLVGGLAGLVGIGLGSLLQRHYRLLLALWSGAFLLGLWLTVRSWERRSPD